MLTLFKKRWAAGGLPGFEFRVAFVFLLLLFPTLRGIGGQNDVDIFFGAANDLRHGKNMYLGPYLYGMWYYYSPFFASVLAPFTFLHLVVLKVSWLLLNLFLVHRCYRVIRWYLPLENNKKSGIFLICLAIISYHLLYLNLFYGQLTILVLWCCLEGVYRIQKNELIKGATIFGLGINVKVLPIFFFYYYLLKNKIKAFVYIEIATVMFVLLPYVWLKTQFHSEIMGNWLDLLNPLNDEHVNTVGEGGFIDFASMVTKYFTANRIPSEAACNLASLTEKQVFWVQMGFRFMVLLVVAWMFFKVHAKVFTDRLKEFADLGFLCACIPLAFPHQRDYSLLLCLPSILILGYQYLIQRDNPGKWVWWFFVISLVCMGVIIFPEWLGRGIKQSFIVYRIPGIGAFIFLLTYCIWMSISARKKILLTKT